MHLHIRMLYNKRCYELLLTSLYNFFLLFLFTLPLYLSPPSSFFLSFFLYYFVLLFLIAVHSINVHLLSSRDFLEHFTYVSKCMCVCIDKIFVFTRYNCCKIYFSFYTFLFSPSFSLLGTTLLFYHIHFVVLKFQ